MPLSGTAVWPTVRPPSSRAETMCVRATPRSASNEARTVLPSTAQASHGASASASRRANRATSGCSSASRSEPRSRSRRRRVWALGMRAPRIPSRRSQAAWSRAKSAASSGLLPSPTAASTWRASRLARGWTRPRGSRWSGMASRSAINSSTQWRTVGAEGVSHCGTMVNMRAVMRPLGWYYSLKTQDGPLCCENGLGSQTVELDHICCIMLFIPHICSDLTRSSGRGQATTVAVTNWP